MATPTATKMTVEGYIEWSERPENAGRKTELVDGEVVDVPPPLRIHCLICGLIATELNLYFRRHGPGFVLTNDAGWTVAPDTLRGVDVSAFRRGLADEDYDRYGVTPPTLCVEVLSPSDRRGMTHKRVQQYLASGVPLVWIVEPDERGVFVYKLGKSVEFVEGDAEITADPELPGFACKVSDFFPPPRGV